MCEPIYAALVRERYHDPSTEHPEAPMPDLAAIEADLRERVGDAIAKGREVLDEVLPKLAKAATDAENDPVVQALEGVVLGPEDAAFIASLVTRLGQAAAGAESHAEPVVDDQGAEVPLNDAGPFVGGTAR